MTTKTTLTALALAAAAFTTLSAGSASANALQNLPGHGPVQTGATQSQLPPHQAGLGSIVAKNPGLVDRLTPPRQVLPYPWKPGRGVPPHESEPGKGSGGEVVSCHPGTGCTITGGDHDHDHDHDYGRDRDRDHDHDWDRDHYHYRDFYRWYHDWSYWYPRWNWTLPPVYTSYYPTPVESCSYEYKWASVYQPGFGLRRVVVRA